MKENLYKQKQGYQKIISCKMKAYFQLKNNLSKNYHLNAFYVPDSMVFYIHYLI
jgi:hypothetical protein